MKKKKKKNVYYQPKFDGKGDIAGHKGEHIYSFQVWRKKKNLIKEYPNCKPLRYSGNDIEEPTFMD